LFEYTALPGGFIVGQGPDDNDCFLYDPSDRSYRSLIAGNARFVRAYRRGDDIAVCAWVPSGNTTRSEFVWATLDEIRALPKLSTPKAPVKHAPIVPIGRRLWFGPFAFSDTAGVPQNCRIPVVQGPYWLSVEGARWRYVAGRPDEGGDGSPAAIERAIERAGVGMGHPIVAYVPRKAQHILPTTAEIQGVESYLGADE